MGDTGPRGRIWDVRGFAVHDGPGIRTAVFFKGCPLSCLWCCNPETQAEGPELRFDAARCGECRACVRACPHAAIPDHLASSRVIDRARCDLCGRCVDACPSAALERVGREVSVDEVLALVARDAVFHVRSGGGLTLTGGEPLSQPAFAAALVHRYKRDAFGASVTIETSGAVPWEAFEQVGPFTDVFLYDLKHADPESHRRLTRADNRLILENLRRLIGLGSRVVLRMPLVPGCNDSDEEVRAVGLLARDAGIDEFHLLPYHRLGERRYAGLGRISPMAGVPALAAESAARARDLLASLGLRVSIGG